MAKQIKAIKCPQCGSSQNTKIGEDRYKCNNCGTEYFLDNDDININVNHRSSPPPNVDPDKTVKTILIVFAVLAVLSFFISTCSRLLNGNRKTPVTTTSTTRTTPKEDKKNPNRYEDSFKYIYAFESDQKQLVVFTLSERKYGESYRNEDPRNGFYATFRNLETNKMLNDQKLDISKLDKIASRQFVDGKTYVIINKRTFYLINKKDLTLNDITDATFSKQEVFSSGIADMEFVYEPKGNGLKLMTNLGKEYFYYPIVNKVYNKDNFYDASFGFRSVLPVAKDVTYYEFTSKSSDFEDEPIQLLRIVYKSNNGGPEEKENNPRWFKDYGGSGIFTDRSPYTKRLFRTERNRIVSYKDITPDRTYFKAGVKYFDDQIIIIKYRPTIAEDAAHIMQGLDANTAEIKWSLDLDTESSGIDDIIKTSSGYLGKTRHDTYILISEDGKIKKTFEILRKFE